ncbi:hypothetical protein GOBAR_AA07711 [Gossypium barbadense]|uniref:Growth-regulating factor n=1 Tax=Gossypium barbadense TaxID=3634 RepID=A0A2P5YBE6_GOSBA|nr:hypothetical protein GOBAR_AA07711 [Gossypium barbadense]
MGSYFSLAQWQELELQALIYRYMLAGAAVPPELLHPIKKSLLYSSSYFLHHYQPAWYWGRAAMDPEPGRCRRTDGKKWRCSRDVVPGQKYCERHVHRGRNRSRKPVEMPTSSSTAAEANNSHVSVTARFGGGGSGCGAVKASSPMTASTLAAVANGPNNFGLSRPSPPVDLLQLNHGTLQDPDNNGTNASPMNSATCLTISMPGNSSSDVSLKLSTGNGDSRREHHQQPPLNWAMGGWAASNQVASMGGPLAEALRSSSTSNSSPTSVLHQLPKGSTSEISYIST